MFVVCLTFTDYEEKDWPAVWQIEVKIASALFGYAPDLVRVATPGAMLAGLGKLVFPEVPDSWHPFAERILHQERENICRFLKEHSELGEEVVSRQLYINSTRLLAYLRQSLALGLFLKETDSGKLCDGVK